MSFSDSTTMLVQPASTGANNGNGWGFDNGLIWLLVLFLFVGRWGNNWGDNGNGNSTPTPYTTSVVTQSDLQRGFDTQSIIGKLDTIGQGICDSTYALNNAVTGGFNANGMAMMQGFNGVQAQMAAMSAENANCCCQTQRQIERGFADTNYNLAQQSCDTRNTIQSTTRDIIDNQNANSRAILDFLAQEKMDALRTELTQAQAQLAQANQTNNLINALRPCPTPAYITCNPWAAQPYGGCAPCGC